MRRIVCLVLSMCILTSAAFAAPYRLEYFDTSNFHAKAVVSALNRYNLSAQYEAPVVKPENNNSSVTDIEEEKDYVTMADVVGGLCVVTSVTKTLYNQEKMTKLTYYVNNNQMEYSCYINDDSRIYAGQYDVEDINVGSLVYISLKEGGIVRRYSVVGIMDPATKTPIIDNSALRGTYSSDKINPVYSYIVDYHHNNDNIAIVIGGEDVIVATSDSKLYTVDINARKTEIISGDCFAADIYESTYDEETDKTTAYIIFAIEYDDEAVFVCSYTTPVEIDGDVTQ